MHTRPEPIEALFADDAKHLIGKAVLCAQRKEGLGYWATLVRFEETFLHTGESRASIQDTRDWADYCMAYADEIKKSRNSI